MRLASLLDVVSEETVMSERMLLGVLLIAAGCSAPPPRAIESDGRPSQVVYFDDLDLSAVEAPQVLYERIEMAAVQMCGSVRAHDVAQAWVRPCVQRAVASAVADVNDLRLQDGRFVLDARAARSASKARYDAGDSN